MAQVAGRLLVVDELGDGRVVAADAAVRVARDLDLAEGHRQSVVGQQVPCQQVADAEDVLEGFGRLQGADDAAHDAEHAGLATGRHGVFRRHRREDAAVARALPRHVGHELALEADDARMYEWLLLEDAGVVDQELRGEVVGAVDDEVVVLVADDIADVLRGHHLVVGVDLDVGVHRRDGLLARLDLGLADILRLMDDLALQVREVDDVEVDEADRADAGGCEVHRGRCAEAARADDEYLAAEQLLLPLAADFVEDDVAGIAFNLFVRQSAHLAPPPMK